MKVSVAESEGRLSEESSLAAASCLHQVFSKTPRLHFSFAGSDLKRITGLSWSAALLHFQLKPCMFNDQLNDSKIFLFNYPFLLEKQNTHFVFH